MSGAECEDANAACKPGFEAGSSPPLCNVWLTLLHGVGVNAARHGDSTGALKEVIAQPSS
jgi:hypothetical protein